MGISWLLSYSEFSHHLWETGDIRNADQLFQLLQSCIQSHSFNPTEPVAHFLL